MTKNPPAEKKILFRAMIEVLGKPQEHVEEALGTYLENLKKNERYTVLRAVRAKAKKQEDQDLWVTFAELEARTEKVEDLIGFCFDYMPSLIEVIEPVEFPLKDLDVTQFLNDLQAKLHNVDMIAKSVKLENDHLHRNMGSLLRNYVILLLSKGGRLTAEQLSKLTGVDQDRLEDFLDTLIDKGHIDLKESFYFLKENSVTAETEN
ncbi:MAG TPA: hypothetical protein VJC21_06320 [Candidatus Nanoarchaeia archaeon]|nr:hypothetical protein [Candidatus Nanoarchaeia archaeon]